MSGIKKNENLKKTMSTFDVWIGKYTKPSIIFCLILMIAVPIFFIINLIFQFIPYSLADTGETLGEYISSLLSILAFLLDFQDYYSQKEELELQREEIKFQREEIKTTRDSDTVYSEVDSMNMFINTFDKGELSLKGYIDWLKQNTDLLNKYRNNHYSPLENYYSNYRDRYHSITPDLFSFINSILSFFKRVEYILKDRTDIDDLLKLSVDKLPVDILALCVATNDYLIALREFSEARGSELGFAKTDFEIFDSCNVIKGYFQNNKIEYSNK